jgi:chitinase
MGDVMPRKQLLSFSQILFACIFFWIIALPAEIPAAVTLQWDPNDPAPEGYRLYKRLDGQLYNDTAVCSVTSTSCTLQEGLEPGMTYFFVVRAFIGNNQSAASNEVSYSVPANNDDSDVGSGGVPADSPPVNNDDQGGNQDEEQDVDDGAASGGSNSAPLKPVLSFPPDGAENTPLTPSLTTLAFVDRDGDRHISSTFQISTLSDFSDPSSLVFDRTFTQYLTTVRIPDLILEPETNYYWRVRFFDDRNGVSEWSDIFQFSTIDFAAAGDHDGNGIIDVQEFNASWDIDENGIADVLQSGLLGVVTPGSTKGVAITRVSENIQVIGILALAPAQLPAAPNRPDNMTGVISTKLLLQNNIASATVKVLFSLPAPYGAAWYQFDPEAGWTVCRNAIFSPDRKSVTLTLEDGGPGDLDGVQNGIIVDMAGLGYQTQNRQIYGSASSSSAADARQCFIGSTAHITGKINAATIILLAAAWMLVLWMALKRQATATARRAG